MHFLEVILLTLLVSLLSSCGDSDNSLPPEELSAIDASVDVSLNWVNKTLEGVGQQYVYLEPLVLEDTVVLVSRQGTVIVTDITTGETIKKKELGVIISAGVGGNSEIVVVATRNGELIALELKTMKIKWRKELSSEVLATPILLDNKVIVRSTDGNIMAFVATTGSITWNYKQTIPALTLYGSSAPVISRDKIFTGLENGRLIALSPSNGEVMWDIALAIPKGRSEINRLVDIDGRAELYGQALYVSSFQGRVAAVDVIQGQFLWARPFSSNTGVTVDSAAIYSTDDQSHIWAIDRFSGATLWKQDKLQARAVTRPVISGEYLLVGDYAGYVHVLSRSDGSFVARLNLNEEDTEITDDEVGILVAPVVIANNNVLLSTRDGNAYSLSLKPILSNR